MKYSVAKSKGRRSVPITEKKVLCALAWFIETVLIEKSVHFVMSQGDLMLPVEVHPPQKGRSSMTSVFSARGCKQRAN